ncbi:MAG: cytidine deaminase [Clostridia bacterium]|nr:cytidine deaminase [Clostridia bacterium]
MDVKKLIDAAKCAQENAYSPYSNFCVGAALLCGDGKIYTGCNIENSSYSATVCAERTAFFKAISEGQKDFTAIAVIGSDDKICMPCGVCRQVISEFCGADFKIICANKTGEYKEYTLGKLLPFSFTLGENK